MTRLPESLPWKQLDMLLDLQRHTFSTQLVDATGI